MRGRPGLSPDVLARVRLHTDVATFTGRIERGGMTWASAVAALALDVPPGRTDIADHIAEIVGRGGGRHPVTVDWPPKATQLALLARARRVMLGDVALVGPDGVRVEQVEVSWPGQRPRRLLRLTQHGYHVGDYRTVDDLARQVDLATLVEDLPPAAD